MERPMLAVVGVIVALFMAIIITLLIKEKHNNRAPVLPPLPVIEQRVVPNGSG